MSNAAIVCVVQPTSDVWWRLDQLQFHVVADATVATRYFVIEVSDAAMLLATLPLSQPMTAGINYLFIAIGSNTNAYSRLAAAEAVRVSGNSPAMFPPGAVITIRSAGVQPGDVLSDLIITVAMSDE